MTAGLALAAAVALASTKPLVISVGGPPEEPAYLAVYVAEALGTFEAEGAKPQLRTAAHPAAAVRALLDGAATVAVTTTDQAIRGAWTRGTPVRILVTHTRAPAAALLVSAKHRSAVSGVQDLRGKRVGVPGPGTTGYLLLAALLQRHRIEPWELDLLSLGGATLAARLGAGDLVAAVVDEPWASRALESGGAAVLLDFRRPAEVVKQFGGPFHEVVSVVPAAAAEPGTLALAGLARALIRVQAWLATAAPEEIADRLPRRVRGDRAGFLSRLATLQETYAPDGAATESGLGTTFRILRGGSPWPAALDIGPRDLLEPPFVTGVRARLGPAPPAP